MSRSRALFLFPTVKKQNHDFHFFFRSIYNKTIIRVGLCAIQNNQGLGEGYQPIIIHHYEKSDWSRAINQFTIVCELDMINTIFHLSCQVQCLPGY